MKVLVIAEGICYPGVEMSGMEAIYSLQKRLSNLGVEIHILTSAYSWSDPSWFKREEERERMPFYYIKLNPWDRFPLLGFFISKVFFLFKILKLRRERFDIVHIYSSAPLLFRLSNFYKKVLKAKVIHTLSTYNTSLLGSFAWPGGEGTISRVICVTQHMRRELAKRRGFKNKLIYLPLGFQASKIMAPSHPGPLKKKLNISENSKVILFIGPFEERKGTFVLARAASSIIERYQDMTFLFVSYGKGGLDPRHREHKEKLLQIFKGKEKFLKVLEGLQDISLLLNETDIFVLPQNSPHGTIGYPLTLLEAMAAGKAIVASDTWGVSELIRDGENGLLFPPGNSQDLSFSLERLLKEETLREKLGEKARDDAKEYHLDRVVQNLVKIYQEVMAQG